MIQRECLIDKFQRLRQAPLSSPQGRFQSENLGRVKE
jgi:hypothetical protein